MKNKTIKLSGKMVAIPIEPGNVRTGSGHSIYLTNPQRDLIAKLLELRRDMNKIMWEHNPELWSMLEIEQAQIDDLLRNHFIAI